MLLAKSCKPKRRTKVLAGHIGNNKRRRIHRLVIFECIRSPCRKLVHYDRRSMSNERHADRNPPKHSKRAHMNGEYNLVDETKWHIMEYGHIY